MAAIGNDREAQTQWSGLLPLTTEAIALDTPGTGIVLHRLAAFQGGGRSVRI
jgi:hypothetical protein